MRQLVSAKAALLVVLTCAAYLPAMRGAFVFDDETLLTDNALINAPDGLTRLWFTNQAIDYWPMTNSTFWFEWRLWRTNPTGYHVTNLALHVAAALLVWSVLEELAIPGDFLGALLFALHPVNVESVAWISQRKNVLAMVFFLLSILFYLWDLGPRTRSDARTQEKSKARQTDVRGARWYWLSLAMFLLAMLSKGSVAVLPALLLLAVWWRNRRIELRDVLRMAPFLVVAIALTAVNLWFRTHGVEFVIRNAGAAERAAGAGAVIWFYLSKALLPIYLLFIYPQWHIEVGEWLWWLPLIAALIVTGLLARRGFSASARWSRALLFAWGFFCVALLPVLGFTDVGFMQYSLVADHYQHIAIVGVAAAVAAGWAIWRSGSLGARRAANAVGFALVALLAYLTFEQSRLYGDSIKLYQSTLRYNPDCWAAHNNLGVQLASSGRRAEAVQHFQRALELKPDYAEAHYNLGNSFAATNNSAQAIEHFREALRIRPGYLEARNNLGIELSRAGQTEEAIECLKTGLKIQPRAAIYFNLGNIYSESDRPQDAAEQFRQAVKLKPDYAEAWANLAATYGDLDRWDEAMAAGNKAMQLARAQGLSQLTAGIEAWRASNAAKLPPGGQVPADNRGAP